MLVVAFFGSVIKALSTSQPKITSSSVNTQKYGGQKKQASTILSRRNIRFCKVIWLINLCKLNKQTTVAITAILRLLGLILIFFPKMIRDYLTTFEALLTLSVIFIVTDDSFARKEFVF